MPNRNIETKINWSAAKNRQKAAADFAQEILEGLSLLRNPVDPEAVAAVEQPFLEVVGQDFGTQFDGQLEYHSDDDLFILFYNTRYDLPGPPGIGHGPRTRFSIAHELGHFYLPEHRAWLLREGTTHPSHAEFTSQSIIEHEADAFAASLLMPEKLLRPLVNEEELTLDRIAELAGQFRTSLVTTAIRTVELSHYACAVAGIRAGALAWMFASQRLIDEGCYPGEFGSLSSSTARKQWASYQCGTAEKAEASGWAREWFRTYGNERLDELPVTEHYLPCPSMDSTIVLLTVPEDELYEDD